MIPQPPNGDMPVVDYYRELHLDRGYSIQEINTKLKEQKQQWTQRASLAGSRGNQARELLALIDQAFEVFKDENSRERYERTLRASSSDNDEGVDWVARAWTYYFAKDYGPATVAARKARESNPTDPTAFVVSAWIELAEDQYDRAEEYASEAFVLDELGEDTFDVHKVRGATFFFQEKYDRAIEAFTRALSRATPVYKAEINWFLANCNYEKKSYTTAVAYALSGLGFEEGASFQDKLIDTTKTIILKEISDTEDNEVDLKNLEHYREQVKNSVAREAPKQTLISFIEGWIEITNILRELVELELKIEFSPVPAFPIKSIGAAIIFFVIFISSPNLIMFLLFVAPSAWVGVYIYMVFFLKGLIRERADKEQALERAIKSVGAVYDGESGNITFKNRLEVSLAAKILFAKAQALELN